MPKHPDQAFIPIRLSLKEALRKKLLVWYSHYRRDLPWRKTKDPYAVWLSEVMLQQTQVQTVVPYYLRFLNAFPTIEDLAGADTQELLRTWAGLGYYSRARNLQLAAREMIRSHGGKFPPSYSGALSLPGIGRYTAGAILSIAFDLPYPVLDGNAIRVLSRMFDIKGDTKKTHVQKLLWEYSRELVPNQHPGDFNQAIMELGALICSPRQPRCPLCPWQSECVARKNGTQDLLPVRRGMNRVRRVNCAVAVLSHRGRVLIIKRNKGRLLRDFWEFPGVEFNGTRTVRAALSRCVLETVGLKIRLLKPLAEIRHMITHRRIILLPFRAQLKPGAASRVSRPSEAKWVRPEDLEKFPFASASRKIVRILQSDPRHSYQ
jgi:A/G-specific adenine glycosylase